jgi:hypothetical protein
VTILLQDQKGDGIQILVTPYDDVKVFTADMIRTAIPDMQISDVQTLEIGDPSTSSGQVSYKGVAFKSDNEAFGGDSREVWFVYPECNRGVCHPQLYQISTYARLDPLLKSLFATWEFF